MLYYKVEITYPNGEVEEINEDFFSVKKAKEALEHILGQVSYNAQFHKGHANVDPFGIVKEYQDNVVKIVYDSRKQ